MGNLQILYLIFFPSIPIFLIIFLTFLKIATNTISDMHYLEK